MYEFKTPQMHINFPGRNLILINESWGEYKLYENVHFYVFDRFRTVINIVLALYLER